MLLMQGIELSRRFFAEIVEPWLASAAPGLAYSAALIGYGSELLGFDDEMSKDHNWGPRVRILVSPDAFRAHAHRLVADFSAAAPAQFAGEPIGWRNRPHPASSGPEAAGAIEHGVEFHTLEGTLEWLVGMRSVDNLQPLDWLGFAEQKLLAFTAGAVFRDDDGRLSEAREALTYFPQDVWIYRIACQWRRIAEEQAFVGRAGQAGDDLGSRVVAARLVRDAMRMAFLLSRTYAPYSKWFGSAFNRLPLAAELSPHLMRALNAGAWEEREAALAAAYLMLARQQVADGIGPRFEPVVAPYFGRPFMTINADDAGAAARDAIADPALKDLPVVGALDQVSDSTPVLEDPRGARSMMRGLYAGLAM
jgi:hypothetical protein